MIKINKDYQITADSSCYTLQKDFHKIGKDGRPSVSNIGYFTTLEGAVNAYAELKLKEKIQTRDFELGEAVNIVKEIREEIHSLLTLNT